MLEKIFAKESELMREVSMKVLANLKLKILL